MLVHQRVFFFDTSCSSIAKRRKGQGYKCAGAPCLTSQKRSSSRPKFRKLQCGADLMIPVRNKRNWFRSHFCSPKAQIWSHDPWFQGRNNTPDTVHQVVSRFDSPTSMLNLRRGLGLSLPTQSTEQFTRLQCLFICVRILKPNNVTKDLSIKGLAQGIIYRKPGFLSPNIGISCRFSRPIPGTWNNWLMIACLSQISQDLPRSTTP